MPIIYQWIFVHFMADFVLQTNKMVQHKIKHKQTSWVLYLHCLVHAALVYLFTPDKTIWIIPAVVGISHYIIDLWKLHRKDSAAAFIIDQALHLLVLFALWTIFFKDQAWWNKMFYSIIENRSAWIIAAGYIFILFPLAKILGYATQKWRHEVEFNAPRSAISLSEAGRFIGMFERILVLTFVITNHFEGIGFLIAAKSILRFNDIKGDNMHKEAEYVLIGTLMSFSASILTGLAISLLIT